jgi:hypothetical protein
VLIRGSLRCGLVVGLVATLGQAAPAQTRDSAFVAMEALGSHRFQDLPDGGRIELTREPTDSAGIAEVRTHLAQIAREFAAGNFSTPGEVHDGKQVPGAATMAAKRSQISYRYSPVTGGGELRIVTRDPEALKAVHQYLAFQRREHTHQH